MTHSPEDKAKVTHTETTEVETEKPEPEQGEPAQPDGKTDSSD
jgi:hypothetical protein